MTVKLSFENCHQAANAEIESVFGYPAYRAPTEVSEVGEERQHALQHTATHFNTLAVSEVCERRERACA